jgi:hypothetical protein
MINTLIINHRGSKLPQKSRVRSEWGMKKTKKKLPLNIESKITAYFLDNINISSSDTSIKSEDCFFFVSPSLEAFKLISRAPSHSLVDDERDEEEKSSENSS